MSLPLLAIMGSDPIVGSVPCSISKSRPVVADDFHFSAVGIFAPSLARRFKKNAHHCGIVRIQLENPTLPLTSAGVSTIITNCEGRFFFRMFNIAV